MPEEHRAEFDELLGEARLTYRLRDERGVFSDIWASGLMRRAVLEGGRRVAERGQIHEPVHLIDAGFDEMCSLLSGADGPSADELAARATYRTTHAAKEAPRSLGDPPPPPPDPSGLPPDVGAADARHRHRARRAVRQLRGRARGAGAARAGGEPRRLRRAGAAASPGRRSSTGSSRETCSSPQSTTEAFNILLPLLGAIVTDSGGLLSHSAIVAREYGIPGVVGTREATERIADGMRVRVDGDAGEVTVLE